MAEPTETEAIKLRSVTLATYREWANSTGRSLTGLVDKVLTEAAMHYIDGGIAVINRVEKVRKEKTK